MKKLYIKTPYPGETIEDAPWRECNTPYMKRMWKKYNKHGPLTTKEGEV